MKCPRCDGATRRDTYEGVQVDRCCDGHGVWLEDCELRSILAAREVTFTEEEIRQVRGVHEKIMTAKEDLQGELACPVCSEVMMRFNYAGTSGVLLDRCTAHGIWFDAGELEHVQILAEEWERLLESDMAGRASLVDRAGAPSPTALAAAQFDLASRRGGVLRWIFGFFGQDATR